MTATAGIQIPLIVWHDVTGTAAGGDVYTMTRAGLINDIRVVSTAAAGIALTVTTTAGVATPAAVATGAAADTPARATRLTAANCAVIVGNTITFTSGGANERGDCMVFLLPNVSNATAIP